VLITVHFNHAMKDMRILTVLCVVLSIALLVHIASANGSALEATPTVTDACSACTTKGLQCLTCNDGRHACATAEEAKRRPVCCGCKYVDFLALPCVRS
jgi:hypothetical protein